VLTALEHCIDALATSPPCTRCGCSPIFSDWTRHLEISWRAWCASAAHREIEPQALARISWLAGNAERIGASDALLEVRQEGRRSDRSCEAHASRCEDALIRSGLTNRIAALNVGDTLDPFTLD